MQTLSGRTDQEKLVTLGEKTYKEQAVWFLNAFWKKFAEREAETVWKNVEMMAQLDTVKKAQGCALDEFMAHHFLEKNDETLTVQKMREQLREVGIDKIRLVPLVHYLIFKYKADWHYLVTAPQGNQEEIAKAQRMLDEVKALLEQAQQREDEARKDEAAAKRAAQEAQAAKLEQEAALAEVKAQEDAYNHRTEDLKRQTTQGGVVQMNKAKNELAQHLAAETLPLRRARITAEAATKKAEKAAIAAAEAAQRAAEARRAAEQAVQAAERKVEEAEAYLEEVKNMPGGEGSVWFIERELHEAKAYMPTSKGGYKKEK